MQFLIIIKNTSLNVRRKEKYYKNIIQILENLKVFFVLC